MRPQNIVKQITISGTANTVQNLLKEGSLEEFQSVPMDETWVVKDLAVAMTANPGTWVLRASGNELGRGMDITVTALGTLSLENVPDLGVTLPPGTTFVIEHTAAGTTTTCALHLGIRRYKLGELY